MIMLGHLSVPPNHGLDQRLYGFSGIGIVPRELWVVLELEWSPRTPPAKFCRDLFVDPQFCPSTLAFILWVSYSPIVLI